MRQITLDGLAVWLVDERPNWKDGVSASFRLPQRSDRGLTAREERKALATDVRTRLSYRSVLRHSALPLLRKALQNLQDGVVAMPFWPAMRATTAPGAADFEAAYWFEIAWDGTGTAYPDAGLPTIPSTSLYCPLLLGHFSSPPDIELLDAETALVSVEFEEDHETSFIRPVFGSSPWPSETVNGISVPVLSRASVWRRRPRSGSSGVEVERKQIGEGRSQASSYYAQSPVRPLEYEVISVDQRQWAALLWLYRATAGGAKAMLVPDWFRSCTLTQDEASGATTLHVTTDDAAALNGHPWLGLFDPIGLTVVRVNSHTPPLPLAVGLPRAHYAQSTLVVCMILCRWSGSELEVELETPQQAMSRIRLREVVEYSTPVGEVLGETLGFTGRTAYLYEFTVKTSPEVITRFTDFERALDDGSNAWNPALIEHGDIGDALNLDKSTTRLKTRWFNGNPLQAFLPFSLEAGLTVVIREVQVADDDTVNLSAATTWFRGEVESVSADGPFIEASCVAALTGSGVRGPNIFDRRIPRLLYQTGCNHTVFDAGCGLTRSAWDVAVLVKGAVSNQTEIEVDGLTPGTPAAHYFAGGLLEWVGGTRYIADNTTPDGTGAMTLTLGTPVTLADNDSITLYPGCDGRVETCHSTFNNRARFGGFPFIPVGNPSMVHARSDAQTGKK